MREFASPSDFEAVKKEQQLSHGPYCIHNCNQIATLLDDKAVKSALSIFAVQFPQVPAAKKDGRMMIHESEQGQILNSKP